MIALVAMQMTAISFTVGTFLMHQNESESLMAVKPCHFSEEMAMAAAPNQADCFDLCLEKNNRFHESDAIVGSGLELSPVASTRSFVLEPETQTASPLKLAANIRPPPNQTILAVQKKE